MLCHQPRMVARATCQDLNGRNIGEDTRRSGAKRFISGSALADCVAQACWLLKDLFEHVMLMVTQTLFISLQCEPRRHPLDHGTGGIKNAIGSSREFGRITVLEINKRVGNRPQS